MNDYHEQNPGLSHISTDVKAVLSRLENTKLSQKDFVLGPGTAQRMYATVYHALAIEFRLPPIENLLLATIISLSHKEGYAWASQSSYAHLLNVTPTTINSSLKKLVKKEMIEKIPNKSRFGTTCWKATARVEDKLKYIQRQIKRDRYEKHGGRI